MPRTLILLLACVAFAFSSVCADAQELWRESEYGMTVDEVRRAFPEAVEPSDPDSYDSGALERFRIDDIEISRGNFRSSFYFLNDRLIQVVLHGQDERDYETQHPLFRRISQLLRMKYGEPSINDEKVTRYSGRHDAIWINGETDITMQLMGVGDFASMNILYRARLAEEADDL